MESVTALLVLLALVGQLYGGWRAAGILFSLALVLVAVLLRLHATSSLNLSF